MAQANKNNEVVLSSLQVKTTANVEHTKRQAVAVGTFLDQVRSAAVTHLLPPNDKTTHFLNALPSFVNVINTLLEPTEGYEDIVWEINITQKGTLQQPSVVVEGE